MNKDLMKQAGFGKEVDQVEMGRCPFCGNQVRDEEFKDSLSRKEFKISGLCQECQDDVFG